MINYFIELSFIHIALILGYWLLLKRERQYVKMRFYLLASTLLAVSVPLLKLPKLLFGGGEPIDAIVMDGVPLEAIAIPPTTELTTWNFDLLMLLYAVVSASFLVKFLSGVVYLVYLRLKSNYERFNGVAIRRVGNIRGSFTFFNWIFLGDEIDKNHEHYDVILKHEKAHASLGHSYDLMFFELFKVCFWWLPTAWLINKEIREIHEYQADACALKSYNLQHYSSILITSVLKSNGISLASSFHDSLILKRLIAMKQQTKNVSPWKLGALAALTALLFTAFACSEEPGKETKDIASESSQVKGEIFTIVESKPEFQGGTDGFYKYVMNEMRYPLEARQKGVEGRVDVEFVVDKDGSLSDVKVINGIGAGCDTEAVRVVQNAPAFKPGTQNGRAVRVRMVVPIIFKLNKGKTNPDNSTQGIIVVEDVESKNSKFKVDAQFENGEWTGTVYDEQGERLPGANIVVPGTTTGTVSNLDGTFKLKANGSHGLVISFIGYETVKVEGK